MDPENWKPADEVCSSRPWRESDVRWATPCARGELRPSLEVLHEAWVRPVPRRPKHALRLSTLPESALDVLLEAGGGLDPLTRWVLGQRLAAMLQVRPPEVQIPDAVLPTADHLLAACQAVDRVLWRAFCRALETAYPNHSLFALFRACSRPLDGAEDARKAGVTLREAIEKLAASPATDPHARRCWRSVAVMLVAGLLQAPRQLWLFDDLAPDRRPRWVRDEVRRYHLLSGRLWNLARAHRITRVRRETPHTLLRPPRPSSMVQLAEGRRRATLQDTRFPPELAEETSLRQVWHDRARVRRGEREDEEKVVFDREADSASRRRAVRRAAKGVRASVDAAATACVSQLSEVLRPESMDAELPAPGYGWEWVGPFVETQSYRVVRVPKASGGQRVLEIPSDALLDVQRQLAVALSTTFVPSAPACAYVTGRNVIVHAAAHASAAQIVQLDLKDFFHSVRPAQVASALFLDHEQEDALDKRYTGVYLPQLDEAGREAILRLCFRERNGRTSLAQGAPTSPVVSNIAAAALDHMIRGWGNERYGRGQWSYTRYADDLVVSINAQQPGIKQEAVEAVEECVERMGWRLNARKTRYWNEAMGTNPQLCGIVLAGDPGARRPALSRDHRRNARAAVRHLCRAAPLPRTERDANADQKAEGTLSWAYSVTGDLRLLGVMSKRVPGILGQVGAWPELLEGWCDGLPGWAPLTGDEASE